MKRAKRIGAWACKLPTGMAMQAQGTLTTRTEVCITAMRTSLAGATESPALLPRARTSRSAMPRSVGGNRSRATMPIRTFTSGGPALTG